MLAEHFTRYFSSARGQSELAQEERLRRTRHQMHVASGCLRQRRIYAVSNKMHRSATL